MLLIVLTAGILNILISIVILRRRSVLLVILHLWWFGWLLISLLSLTGLYPPSNFTIALFVLLLTSITAGAGIYALICRQRGGVPKYILWGYDRGAAFLAETTMLKLVFFTALPFTIFFFIRMLFLIGSEPDLAAYRAKVFGIGLGYSLLFRFPVIESINQFVIEPINLAALFLGVSAFILHQRHKLLLTAFLIIILHSLMMMGRFGFHYIFMMLLFIIACKISMRGRIAFRSIKGIIVFVVAIFVFASTVTHLRSSDKLKGLRNTITMYVIDYHTVSFSIFDRDLQEPKSVLHIKSFGRSSLGPFDRIIVNMLGLFGVEKNAQPDLNGLALMPNREVGRDPDGNPKFYNAFGSVLYSLYRDGRQMFIIFAGVIFGFLASFFSESLRYKNSYGITFLTALAFIGIYGIFQPVLEGPALLSILIIVITYKKSSYGISESLAK